MFLSDFGQELFYSRLKLCHPINICPYLNSEDCSDVSTVLKKPPFWMVFSLNASLLGICRYVFPSWSTLVLRVMCPHASRNV